MPSPKQVSVRDIIIILFMLLNTYLVLNGRQQLSVDMLNAADHAAINAAASAARDCQAVMRATPVGTPLP